MAIMGRILVGISAWADQQLVKSRLFYPSDAGTPAKRLRYYAERFDLAEIDASYHYLPTRNNLKLWLENTPPGFTFNIKALSLFTQHPTPFGALPRTIREKLNITQRGNIYLHHLPSEVVAELYQAFKQVISPLSSAGRLGAVLFQFPPWFVPQEKNFEHITKCKEEVSPYAMAVEFRVGRWFDDENRERTLDFLRQQQISLVCVDEPLGLRSSVPAISEITAPLGIVRFHGRNKANWEKKGVTPSEKSNYLYREEELKEWLPRIRYMAEQSHELHIVFKNKFQDFPVRNALQMKVLLE